MEEKEVPKECVLKVFKTTLNEFKNRDKYIKDDYRFKDRFSKLNPRKVIRLWAEKEMHNLARYRATKEVVLPYYMTFDRNQNGFFFSSAAVIFTIDIWG